MCQKNISDVIKLGKRRLGGFTLVELLVVVLIIGILAAIGLPQYTKAVERARAVEAVTNLRALVTAEKVYQMSNGIATTDLTLLDLQLNGEINDGGKMVLSNFTYDVHNIGDGQEGFEIVASRNSNGNEVTDYYIYYSYVGGYACVARNAQAKTICAAICSSSQFIDHENGKSYYCRIQ